MEAKLLTEEQNLVPSRVGIKWGNPCLGLLSGAVRSREFVVDSESALPKCATKRDACGAVTGLIHLLGRKIKLFSFPAPLEQSELDIRMSRPIQVRVSAIICDCERKDDSADENSSQKSTVYQAGANYGEKDPNYKNWPSARDNWKDWIW